MREIVEFRNSILALSDLTDKSDAALQLAGRLARVLDVELHILHALGMKHRALRAVVPALNNLNATVATVEDALRAQCARVLPDEVAGRAVQVVDLDGPLRALRTRAAQSAPMALVTAYAGDWAPSQTSMQASMPTLLARLAAPMFLVREPRQQTHHRVLLLSSATAISSETVAAAGRWGFWLEHVNGRGAAQAGPALDVLLLEAGMSLATLMPRLTGNCADLIAIDQAVLDQADLHKVVATVMPVVIAQKKTPIVFLPNTVTQPGGERGRARPGTPLTAA
jgi:hypothetical protein